MYHYIEFTGSKIRVHVNCLNMISVTAVINLFLYLLHVGWRFCTRWRRGIMLWLNSPASLPWTMPIAHFGYFSNNSLPATLHLIRIKLCNTRSPEARRYFEYSNAKKLKSGKTSTHNLQIIFINKNLIQSQKLHRQ